MNRVTSIYSIMVAVAIGASSRTAEAACDTEGTDTAYGDFWIERSGASCDCVVKQAVYSCVADEGYRTKDKVETIATVSGDCSTACEDLSGYDTAVQSAMANWTPGEGYDCDSTFTDNDQDGFGACIDEDDDDPRVWVKISANETICDGVDNDNDGTVDDGITGCSEDHDHKRLGIGSLYQGKGGSSVNVVEGNLIVRQVDAVVRGPFGPLVLARTYDSRRETADADAGEGWVHSFAVYLEQMPAGDDRWRVQTSSGEMQYFRCETYEELPSALSCVIDDHRPRGNLRRTGGSWYFYPGDGTVYRFEDNDTDGDGRFAWDLLQDSGGNKIASAALDSSGRIQKVETDNSAIFLYFSYGTYGLDAVRLSSETSNQILDYDVDSNNHLDKVKFASSLNTIDNDVLFDFSYDPTSENLDEIQQKLDNTTTLTMAEFTFDGSDRVLTIKDSSQDLSISYASATTTDVTYKVESSGNDTTTFTHNGLWVTDADDEIRLGGLMGPSVVYDEHGRITCYETDDSRMYKFAYSDGTVPIEIDEYGKSGTCSSGGTVKHETWLSWEYNTSSQSWRREWVRTKSVYNPATGDCTGVSLPSGCAETKYEYVGTDDDRVQWITRTGSTKNASETVSQQIRKQRFYYYGDGCSNSGDFYAGLLCKSEIQDNSSNVYARTEYTYYSTSQGTEPDGALKKIKRYRKDTGTLPSLDTTFASYNDFGTAEQITDPRGMVTDLSYNGWNALTSVTENDAIINNSGTLLDLTTSYSYNDLRRIDTVTLPKGNKRVYIYMEGTGEYGRLKAFAKADASANLTEILRYEYDGLGRQTEQKIIDSINGTTPCADEDCGTLDGREQSAYDALGRITTQYLHAADTSDPADATMTYTYLNGKLDEVQDFLGKTTSYTYDDQGRISTMTRDDGGIDAETSYSYDGQGNLLTTTSPTSVVTRSERNDFGEVVLERSKTRGDIHREYDVAGRLTKQRETAYNSQTSIQNHCWSYDWLGRKTEYDEDCDSSADANLYYDGDSAPGSACDESTVQKGRLSMHTNPKYKRVLCYHPNGRIHSMFQVMGTSTWSNSGARGFTRIYDKNGNLEKEYVEDRPDNDDHAREIEYVYDSTLKDRIQYVRHKLTSAGTWTKITSSTTDPTYFAFGGFKTIKYENGIVETNTYDKARRLTRRKTDDASTTYTDINLTYDDGSRITHYDDSAGKRHLEYYTAYDDLNRLRCAARGSISSCSGTQPWDDDFIESLDYDDSGNRTFRSYGQYGTDDDEYTYVTDSDIIDKVKVAGTDKQMSNSVEGEITELNTPDNIVYTFNKDGTLTSVSNSFLGDTDNYYTEFRDRFMKVAVCNSRESYYFYNPTGAGGSSHQPRVIDNWYSCASEFPRRLQTYVYLEGRPIAVIHSDRLSSSDDQTEVDTYWIHTDQLGTPIMVTEDDGTERWRWENDPFGRNKPVEFGVTEEVLEEEDDSSSGETPIYNTCCCDTCGSGTCNNGTSGCSTGCCDGSSSQDVVWSKTYTVTGAQDMRLHFSAFDVADGTSRTSKDYVELMDPNDTVFATLTGDLGAHWSPWVSEAGNGDNHTIKLELVADNVQDGTRGVVVDKLEYVDDNEVRFVLDLRMPGQIWDEDAHASYNFHRWYRSEDGRYLSPDPIGLAGGEPGYFGYAGGNPNGFVDPSGLSFSFNPPKGNVPFEPSLNPDPHSRYNGFFESGCPYPRGWLLNWEFVETTETCIFTGEETKHYHIVCNYICDGVINKRWVRADRVIDTCVREPDLSVLADIDGWCPAAPPQDGPFTTPPPPIEPQFTCEGLCWAFAAAYYSACRLGGVDHETCIEAAQEVAQDCIDRHCKGG